MIDAIRKALETRLAALSPAWVTSYEATSFEPTPGASFQEVALLPGQPVSNGIFGAALLHLGIFQVLVCTGNTGGPNVSDLRAKAIQSHFKRGTSLAIAGYQNLWVPDQPTISAAILDATWRKVPVTIPYNALEPGG